MCLNIDDCVNRLLINDQLAVGVSREIISKHKTYILDEIFCFDQNEHIESFQIGLLIRSNGHLINIINKEINACLEAGLISKWLNDNKLKKINSDTIDDIYIEMKHILALFIFNFGIGFSLAASTFFMEQIAHSKKFRFLNKFNLRQHMENFVDGRRHYLLN